MSELKLRPPGTSAAYFWDATLGVVAKPSLDPLQGSGARVLLGFLSELPALPG
jgi:hypothetical protein